MGVNHGGGNVLVTEESLDGANIHTSLQKVRGKAVPKGVRRYVFGNAIFFVRCDNSLTDRAGIKVMPAGFPSSRVCRKATGRENILPLPLFP